MNEDRHVDLTADLHGHALEYMSDLDRAYFDAHPSAVRYVRSPVEHERCCPACVAEDHGCVPLVGHVTAVVVNLLAPGLRSRQPLTAGPVDHCPHRDQIGTLSRAQADAFLNPRPAGGAS